MVDHESMVKAFQLDSIPVNRADPGSLEAAGLADAVFRVLTEVGLPESFRGHVHFDALRKNSVVLRQIAAGRPRSRSTLLHIGTGGDGEKILVDGLSGEMTARLRDKERRISRSIDSFIEFLYLMQIMLDQADRQELEDENEINQMLDGVAARLAEADPETMALLLSTGATRDIPRSER